MLERLKIPLFIAAALAALAGVIALLSYQPPLVAVTLIPPPPTATPAPIQVYVTGAVHAPDRIYALPPGARVAAAIEAAGGLLPEADKGTLNLAALLRDGEKVHIKRLGEPAAAATNANIASGGKVKINMATAEELETLPGVGPALAKAILDHRAKVGRFNTMGDLDSVPGVGPSKIAQWEGLIDFE
jgi:competence protein ComEA